MHNTQFWSIHINIFAKCLKVGTYVLNIQRSQKNFTYWCAGVWTEFIFKSQMKK